MERHTQLPVNLIEQQNSQLKSQVIDCRMQNSAGITPLDKTELYIRHLVMQIQDGGAVFMPKNEPASEATTDVETEEETLDAAERLAVMVVGLHDELQLPPELFMDPEQRDPVHKLAAKLVSATLAARSQQAAAAEPVPTPRQADDVLLIAVG